MLYTLFKNFFISSVCIPKTEALRKTGLNDFPHGILLIPTFEEAILVKIRNRNSFE